MHIIFATVWLYFIIISSANGQVGDKITNGENANPNEFPFLVSIRNINGQHFCGGSILTPQWILTAAHCLAPVNEIEIVAGEHILNQNEATEQIRRIDASFAHPDYVNVNAGNDIALLRLTTDLEFNNAVQPVSLEPVGYVKATVATVMGWGTSQRDIPENTNILQKVTVPIVSQQQCALVIADLPDSVLCAGGEGRGTCAGDSGGPLICTSLCDMGPVQCGIVSFGPTNCGERGGLEGFTRIPLFIDFLMNTITANSRPARSEL